MNISRASYHRLIVLLPLAALGLGLVAWGLGKGLGQTSLVPVFGMVGALALAVCAAKNTRAGPRSAARPCCPSFMAKKTKRPPSWPM